MSRNSIPLAGAGLLLLSLTMIAVLVACAPSPVPMPPTADLAVVQTQAVATFASGLTSTVQAVPSNTATLTPPPVTEPAATEGTAGPSPTPSCYRLKYVRDVTIPDNTLMTPAQVFTKTWQVENNGKCAWKAGFKMMLFGGNAMGGSPFTLESTVNPGGRAEISIKMVAPTNQTGVIIGTWRMQDDTGAFFGDAIYVQIVIGGPTLAAPTAEATGTP